MAIAKVSVGASIRWIQEYFSTLQSKNSKNLIVLNLGRGVIKRFWVVIYAFDKIT
jgi:hypothetical protein